MTLPTDPLNRPHFALKFFPDMATLAPRHNKDCFGKDASEKCLDIVSEEHFEGVVSVWHLIIANGLELELSA